jgi:hypothetical protein
MSDRKSFSLRDTNCELVSSSRGQRNLDLIRQSSTGQRGFVRSDVQERASSTSPSLIHHSHIRSNSRNFAHVPLSSTGLRSSARSDIQGQGGSTRHSLGQENTSASQLPLNPSTRFATQRRLGETEESSRRTSSLRDTIAHSLRDSLRPFDLPRPLSTGYTMRNTTYNAEQRYSTVQTSTGSVRGEDRGKLPYDHNLGRSVDEYGKSIDKVIIPDKEGLFAGAKLDSNHWYELESRLENIKREFNSLDERKQRNVKNGVDNSKDEKVKNQEDKINLDLGKLRSKVDNYVDKGDDDDYRWLDKINEHRPKDAEETAFLASIHMCLGYVASGKIVESEEK